MANKFILVYALIFFIVGYLLQTALPWYSMALLALVLGYASKFKPAQSLYLFFLMGALLCVMLAYWKDTQSRAHLSDRIGILFGVKNLFILLGVTSVIGGITSGLGAWCGSLFAKYLRE